MFGSIGGAVARLLRSTSSRNRPWQIASAMALGVACGLLVPNGILPLLFLAVGFLLPIHFPLALLTTLVVGMAGWSFDPMAGRIGGWALAQPQVVSWIAGLNRYPLVPWLRLNNTVVLGTAMLATFQLLPTFILVLPLARWLCRISSPSAAAEDETPQASERMPSLSYVSIDFESVDALESSRPDTAASPSVADSPKPLAAPMTSLPSTPEEAIPPRPRTATPVERVETFLAECHDAEVSELPTSGVAARASELAALVDEMLVALQEEENQEAMETAAPTEPGMQAPRWDQPHQPVDGSDRGHRQEPNTERMSQPITSVGRKPDDRSSGLAQRAQSNSQGYWDPMTPVGRPQGPAESPPITLSVEQAVDSAAGPQLLRPHEPHAGPQHAAPPIAETASPHEEALRYLLHHLKEIKDKV